jgi:hypothetical protein
LIASSARILRIIETRRDISFATSGLTMNGLFMGISINRHAKYMLNDPVRGEMD